MRFYFAWIHPLLDALDAITWLTIGLVLFAGAQVFIMYRTELRTRRDQREEREREQDLAHDSVYAEWFRLFGLYNRWRKADFIGLSLVQSLDPNDLRVHDPSLFAERLARLGPIPARLGIVGLTRLADAMHDLHIYNRNVDACVSDFTRKGEHRSDQYPRVVRYRGETFDKDQERILQYFREAMLLLEDALRESPRAHIPRSVTFIDRPRSQHGKSMSEKADKIASGVHATALRESPTDIFDEPITRTNWRDSKPERVDRTD